MIPIDKEFPLAFNEQSVHYLANTPDEFQQYVASAQRAIDQAVRAVNPNATRTSGFRDPRYNASLAGSKSDSPHLYGCATDYSLRDDWVSDIPGYLCIVEHDHYHVQPLAWKASR